MKPFRVTIAAFLGIIAVASVGLMAMREGKPVWASVTFCLTLAFLLVASLVAIVGPGERRPGATGFALFGWIYLATVFGPWGKLEIPPMPQEWLAGELVLRVYPNALAKEVRTGATWTSTTISPPTSPWNEALISFHQAAHSLGALLFAALGLVAARWIARSRPLPHRAE